MPRNPNLNPNDACADQGLSVPAGADPILGSIDAAESEAQAIFNRAVEAQHAYWDALSDLEAIVLHEIDNVDLGATTLEALMADEADDDNDDDDDTETLLCLNCDSPVADADAAEGIEVCATCRAAAEAALRDNCTTCGLPVIGNTYWQHDDGSKRHVHCSGSIGLPMSGSRVHLKGRNNS